MKKLSAALLATAFAFTAPSLAFAADEAAFSDTLTGDWNGARTKLANQGVTLDAIYKLDVFANTTGGIKRSVRGLDNLDVLINLDGEKLLGSKGTTALIHVLNNDGDQPDGDLVGSAQGIDNIEVPKPTAKLYQAWIQQNFYDDKLSILGGLYDVNSEFYVTDLSALFLHSTYGIGTEVAQSGANGPSIFPFTSVGVRVKVQPTAETYAQVVALDGVPGDPNNLKGTHVQFNNGDGTFWVAEAGITPEGSKLAVGGWYYTAQAAENVGTGQQHNHGVYVIGEHEIYKGLSAFGRFGVADQDVNQFTYAWSAGLVYTGLIPGRPDGQLGFGVAGAHNASSFRDAQTTAGTPVDSAETALELTYSDNITPWLSVQPDVQYVINPGTDPTLDNALAVGTRFTVKF